MKKYYLFFLICFIAQNLQAQMDGDLDLSFNNVGYNTFAPGPLHDNINRVAIQASGKVVFAGQSNSNNTSFSSLDVVVGRTQLDGTLDMTFGVNGYFTLTNNGGSDFAYDMEILPNGKIIIGGGFSITAANTSFLVIRLNADGTPDTTFGNNGYVTIDFDQGEDYCRKVFPQPDGSIICVGWASISGFTYNRIAVCKVNENGTQDMTFGEPLYQSAPNQQYNVLDGMQVGNSLYVCGSVYNSNLFADLPMIVKLTTDGKLDNSLDGDGFYFSSKKGYYTSMVNNGNGFYICGDNESTNDYDALITSMDYNGIIQTGFGNMGFSQFNKGVIDGWSTITLQPNNKILVAGVSGTSNFNRFLIGARFTSHGDLDPAFGQNGVITFDKGSFFDVANDLALQADGKIIIGGVTASDNNNMLLIRLLNDATTDVEEIQENNFNIFPTISSGTFYLSRNSDTESTIKVYHAAGHCVYSSHWISNQSECIIQLDHLPPGIYFIEMKGEVKRVIIE